MTSNLLCSCKGKDRMNSFLNATPWVWLVRNHEFSANFMRWIQFAIVLPCLVIGAPSQATDKRSELSNGGVMGDVGIAEKFACVRPVEVGPMKPTLFEKSESGIKSGAKAIGRDAEPSSVFACNSKEMWYEQGGDGASDSKQPQVNGGEVEAEDIHPGLKALIIGMTVAAFISLFSVPKNTVLASHEHNEMYRAKPAL